MDIQIHHTTETLPEAHPVLYMRKAYLKAQEHNHLLVVENENFYLPLRIEKDRAISMEKSPFGSFFSTKPHFDSNNFDHFHNQLLDQLARMGVRVLEIRHPSNLYSSFVSKELLLSRGYQSPFADINQHIPLDQGWESRIHKMQQRKLAALIEEGFEFRQLPKSELKVAYQFLSVCRQTQGLALNISWDVLNALSESMPDAYQCFAVFREGRISSLCITVNVTKDIAYYYLPATSPMFRTHSPMVLLIAGMVDYFRSKGFVALDLGISSIQGKPQETLRIFKERMGAVQNEKPTLIKSI